MSLNFIAQIKKIANKISSFLLFLRAKGVFKTILDISNFLVAVVACYVGWKVWKDEKSLFELQTIAKGQSQEIDSLGKAVGILIKSDEDIIKINSQLAVQTTIANKNTLQKRKADFADLLEIQRELMAAVPQEGKEGLIGNPDKEMAFLLQFNNLMVRCLNNPLFLENDTAVTSLIADTRDLSVSMVFNPKTNSYERFVNANASYSDTLEWIPRFLEASFDGAYERKIDFIYKLHKIIKTKAKELNIKIKNDFQFQQDMKK